MNIEVYFNKKIAIQCKIVEEWKKLLLYINDNCKEVYWGTKRNVLLEFGSWSRYEKETCLSFDEYPRLWMCYKKWYEENGFFIVASHQRPQYSHILEMKFEFKESL